MLKLAKLSILAVGVAMTTAATQPAVGVQPLIIAPLAIIEGGTVSTLPKGVKSRGGKVVVLRRGARKPPARPKPAVVPVRHRDATREPARSCACATAAGGSSSDVVELRTTEQGLRVVIIGPDGQTRSRYVPAPPGSTARHSGDE